jgi:hypothetical protein
LQTDGFFIAVMAPNDRGAGDEQLVVVITILKFNRIDTSQAVKSSQASTSHHDLSMTSKKKNK